MNDNMDSGTLADASRDEQLEAMEEWFRARYEDPAERTPYESREGGYIWIWGGPYDAEEELRGEFEGIVPDDVIEELVDVLNGECSEWAPMSSPDDYDEGLYEAVSSNALARQTLDHALDTIRALLNVDVEAEVWAAYSRLLFANAITAMETYLSDTFINLVSNDEELLQKYIDSDPKFKERKVAYKDILREAQRVEEEARKELLDVVWHNVGKVKAMYAQVLGVNLGNTGLIGAAVQIRHDIVHRNGRQKDGTMIDVSCEQILNLLDEISKLAWRVEAQSDYGFEIEENAPEF
jgi:hypothetical protein